jgi:ligand-binding sensor domain-containing protein/AraC-like DNA-binding protein
MRFPFRMHIGTLILRALLAAAALSAAGAPPAAALDAGLDPAEYIVRAWGIGEGLPQNSVTAVIQTADGYIWAGTYSGLVRFDGVEFTIHNRWNTPGLASDRISALLEGPGGEVYVGTHGGGLSRLGAGGCRSYTSREGLSNDYVTSLFMDSSGALWVGTEDGLNRMRGDEITSFSTWHGLGGNSITALAADAAGRLLIGCLVGGVSVLEDVTAQEFKPLEDMPARAVNSLAVDASGRIWAGGFKGLYVLEGGEARLYSRKEGLPRTPVSALVTGSGGDLFIGLLGGGLVIMRGGEFIDLSGQGSFPNDPVHAIMEDRDGSVWAGTDTRGLVQIKDPLVRMITSRQGLTGDAVTAVMYDSRGGLWVGTEDSGLCLTRGGRVVRVFNTLSGLPSSRVRCLLEDAAGNIWVGTEGGGLSRLGGDRVATFTTGDGLSSDDVTALLEDPDGTLWIGTARGLNRMRDGVIRAYDRTVGLRGAYIRTLFEDGSGVLHIGTRQGLIKFYDHTPLPLYLNEEGMEPDVLCIYGDADGSLWVGTAGNGLIRYDENRVTTYTTRDGLFDNNIFSIVPDGEGNLYMSSYVGIFSIPAGQLAAVSGGTERRFTPALYDEEEGLTNRQCTFEGEPSACLCRDGKMYFATIEGVAVFDPQAMSAPEAPPRAVIEGMSADNLAVEGSDPAIPRGSHVLEFDFTAIDFLAPDKLRFEYRLEGYDEDWNRLGFRSPRTAYYFNLDPGDYAFAVRAAGNRGGWDSGAALHFSITRPFYMRAWVYAVALPALAAAGAVLLMRRRRGRATPEKYSTSALPEERIEEVLPKLKRLMEEEKVYLDAELNLQELARRAGIHYNYLSRIINEKFGLSYNDYVNGYRIEEARRMLADPANAGKTILDIAYDTGFYSKSVFNTAFKKITGTTPSQYRKQSARQDS